MGGRVLGQLAMAGALFVLTALGSSAQTPARRTAAEGVYTVEQARRGETAYNNYCVQCHGRDLGGHQDASGDAPALAGDQFFEAHRTKALDSLFIFMKANMPAGSAGSLEDADYAAILAYLLESNDFPAGQMALPATPAVLAGIWFEPAARPGQP